MCNAVLFDFGGVVAEEGFRDGLRAIGEKNGLDQDRFFAAADELIFDTGYLTGRADEATYWKALRARTGVTDSDDELRSEILKRFVLRPEVIEAVDCLRRQGAIVAILSDQTNWLEELDRTSPFFRHFDRVFNSYNLHKSKRDPSVFRDVCRMLGVESRQTLFVDDNAGHIRRAAAEGLQTIHFTTVNDFEKQLARFTKTGKEVSP